MYAVLKVEKTRVCLDGIHSLDISVNQTHNTVIAELILMGSAPKFIYAEKFDVPCNYLREAIKKSLSYLNGNVDSVKDLNGVHIDNEQRKWYN